MLLRITTDTGDKHFSRAAAALEPVGTAGHLVSMVVADGVDNAPTALLANHMENSLATAVAKEGSNVICLLRDIHSFCHFDCGPTALSPEYVVLSDLAQAEEDVMCYSRVAEFLLNCLIRIPIRTCQALLQQVSDAVRDYH